MAKSLKKEPELAESYFLFGVQVDSFMRLKSANVEFDPAKGSVTISGRNKQGKTSFQQAIWTALGGKKVTPEDPVHNSEEMAEIILDLVPTDDPHFESAGRIRVCRTITAGGKWSLKIFADGRTNPFKSPQALLDEFFNHLAFDPSEFTRMKPEKQAAVIISLAGVQEAADQLRAGRLEVYEERTAVNTLLKSANTRLSQLPALPPGANSEVKSAAEILKQLEVARAEQAANAAKRQELAELRESFTQGKQTIALQEEEIARLKSDLADAEAALVTKVAGQEALQAKGKELKLEADALIDPDISALSTQLEDLEQLNEQARQMNARKAAREEVAKHEAESKRLTGCLDKIDDQIADLLTGAELPIDGLSIMSDGTVYFKGHPFAQASSAEELEVSLAMGAAMHPKLRFLALKEASMMDDETRKSVEAWAADHGYFVLMELATADHVGIHIEDGEVVTP